VSPVLDPDLLVRHRPDARERLRLAAAVLIGLAALVPLVWAMRAPAVVDAVTVVNESPYDVHVDVRGPGGPALGLGTVPREREVRFTSVLDQGDTWSFTLTSAGVDGGTVEVARDALERDGWRLTLPATTTARLNRADLPPAPRTRTDG
jgi:hypothetical protein